MEWNSRKELGACPHPVQEAIHVGMLVIVLPHTGTDVALGPDAASRVARLGVTSIGLVRDQEGVGVVLEGWAFDPASSEEEALAAIAGGGSARVLHPVAQLSVHPGSDRELSG